MEAAEAAIERRETHLFGIMDTDCTMLTSGGQIPIKST